MGNPANFKDNNPENDPLNANILGTVYKGGIIVPILMTLALTVLTFAIERFLTIYRARGTSNMDTFLKKVKFSLENGDITTAMADCDKQKGSLGNVVKAGLHKYKQMEADTSLDKDAKVAAIQKELEEATSLELPMLEKNLVFLATIASIATLMGLFGTVLGMIRAFAALALAGAPDAGALANGISEALINTALGIGRSGWSDRRCFASFATTRSPRGGRIVLGGNVNEIPRTNLQSLRSTALVVRFTSSTY